MSELKVKTSTFDIQIGDKTVKLRLTVSAQLRLKNKFKQDTIDTILEASADVEKLLAIFDEALSYKDNENEGMTGEELYDVLVDTGVKGINAFAGILFNIANASGILSDKQKEQVESGIDKSYTAIFEHIENGVKEEEHPHEHGDTSQPVRDSSSDSYFRR